MAETKEYLPWSESFSVGLQEIDEQHKILIALINRLYSEAILNKADKSTISSILDELIQYTIVHFSVEESLFRIFDYSEGDAHQNQHEQFKKSIINFQRKFEDGAQIDVELMSFLRKWLKDHIMINDKKYTSFFLEKGFKSSWSKERSWAGKIWDSITLK